jgi:hypothetical protein
MPTYSPDRWKAKNVGWIAGSRLESRSCQLENENHQLKKKKARAAGQKYELKNGGYRLQG